MSTANYQTEVVIIIPFLSNIDGLENLLNCLIKENKSFPIVIVNNGAKPMNEIKDLSMLPLTIIDIHEPKNVGFAKACNDGAKKAKELFQPQFLLFLNDDVTFTEKWIDSCLKELKEKKWIATTPVLLKSNGSIENVGYRVMKKGKVELEVNRASQKIIDGLSATALIIKSTEFFTLNGFDERFFAYLEDVDLFLRLKKEGKKFGVTKNSVVFHAGQATSSKNSVKKAYLDFRNWVLLIGNNYTPSEIISNFPSIALERMKNAWGIVKATL